TGDAAAAVLSKDYNPAEQTAVPIRNISHTPQKVVSRILTGQGVGLPVHVTSPGPEGICPDGRLQTQPDTHFRSLWRSPRGVKEAETLSIFTGLSGCRNSNLCRRNPVRAISSQ
ncbi:Hypothetical predicted protein, partial [Marmota monax]